MSDHIQEFIDEEAMPVPEVEARSPQVDETTFTEVALGDDDEEEVEQSNEEYDAGDEEEEELTKEEILSKRRACYIKVFIGLLVVGFVVFVIVDALTAGHVKDAIDSFLDWVEDNPVAGMFAFILGRSIFVPCLPPAPAVCHS